MWRGWRRTRRKKRARPIGGLEIVVVLNLDPHELAQRVGACCLLCPLRLWHVQSDRGRGGLFGAVSACKQRLEDGALENVALDGLLSQCLIKFQALADTLPCLS